VAVCQRTLRSQQWGAGGAGRRSWRWRGPWWGGVCGGEWRLGVAMEEESETYVRLAAGSLQSGGFFWRQRGSIRYLWICGRREAT
jgi:hypothetical protein